MNTERRNVSLLLLTLVLSCYSSAEGVATQSSLSQGRDLSSHGSENAAANDGDTANSDKSADDAEDDDDDDDDDTDDDTDDPATGSQKVPAAVTDNSLSLLAKKPAKQTETPSGLAKEEDDLEKQMSPHAREQTRLKNEVTLSKQNLATNLHKQAELKRRIQHLSNEVRSDEEIDGLANRTANETEAPAMAGMMAGMWKDMRMFEVPSYEKAVEEKLQDLKKDQQKLESKLNGANDKLSEAEGKWSKEGAGAKAQKLKPTKEQEDDDLEDNVLASKGDKRHAGKDVGNMAKTSPMMSTWNFWKMSHKQQESFFVGSLVYIIGGILLAFGYNRVRATHPMFAQEKRRDKDPNPKDFGFSLLGCFAAGRVAVMGCFCPCLRWADTMDRMDILPYWKAFAAFFALLVLHCYSWGISSLVLVALGVWFRQKLRNHHGIENATAGSVAMDILAWLCCQPCAIIQEAREESIPRSSSNV